MRQSYGSFLDRVFHQAPETTHAILPTDLLPFLIGATPVTDSHFVDAQPPLGNFDRDFRFKTEAVLLERLGGRRATLNYGVYLKLLTYMYRVGPIVAMPPQVDLFVPHALNRNGAETLGTAWV